MKRDHPSLRQQKGIFKSKSDANALDKLVFTSLSPLENVDIFLQAVIVMFLYGGKHKSKWHYCLFCLLVFFWSIFNGTWFNIKQKHYISFIT